MLKNSIVAVGVLIGLCLFIAGCSDVSVADDKSLSSAEACPEALSFKFRKLGGKETVNLCKEYKGKVVMIVNTASKCGFTPQYEGLESLYRKYKDRGFVILGFPSNDFGRQEPGTEKQIADFCKLTYGVEFPMFEKTRVAKRNADPIYQTLGRIAGEFPEWNFHKYIINREGKLIASFASRIKPQSDTVVGTITKLL
jgi:glutathione peroxidase